MQFKIGAEVIISFKNGSEVRDFCEVPKGFAGDKDKLNAVSDKFNREAFPVLGEEKALKIKNLILQLEDGDFRKGIQNVFFNT